MTKTRLLFLAAGLSLLIGCARPSAPPVMNISPARHPNLAAAQRLSLQAWQRIVDAQRANEGDMNGHAQRAKELLDQANQELKLAALQANQNHR